MPTITPKRAEYARMWVAGVPHMEIARRMGVTKQTVSGMLSRIRRRYSSDRRELAAMLGVAEIREWDGGGRPSGHGYVQGDALRIVGGRYAGRDGTYVSACNSHQVRVQVGGAVLAIRVHYLERRA